MRTLTVTEREIVEHTFTPDDIKSSKATGEDPWTTFWKRKLWKAGFDLSREFRYWKDPVMDEIYFWQYSTADFVGK